MEAWDGLGLFCACMQLGHTIESDDRQHRIAVVMEVRDL